MGAMMDRAALENWIIGQYQKYPDMQAVDMVKLLYQNEFGCGHMAPEEAASLRGIREEAASLADTGEDVSEYIGNGLCRLHLRALRRYALRPETLNRFFLQTAKKTRGSAEGFAEKLAVLREICARGELPFAEISMGEGIPRHSARYRAAYAPAYRLVDRAYCDFLPIFCAIDARFRDNGRVIVAIDGQAAAGKSTLAALLRTVYDCNVFHVDDFFLQPYQRTEDRLNEPGGNVDYERFDAEIIQPLRGGRSVAYRRYHCQTGELSAPQGADAKAINIIEGVYSLHPRFGEPYDIKVFLKLDAKNQRRRLLERNAAMYERFMDEWVPMEQGYFDAFSIPEQCDFVLDTSSGEAELCEK